MQTPSNNHKPCGPSLLAFPSMLKPELLQTRQTNQSTVHVKALSRLVSLINNDNDMWNTNTDTHTVQFKFILQCKVPPHKSDDWHASQSTTSNSEHQEHFMIFLLMLFAMNDEAAGNKYINHYIKTSTFSFYPAMHYVHSASAFLRSHVVCLSVCDVGDSLLHRLEILEINCTNN